MRTATVPATPVRPRGVTATSATSGTSASGSPIARWSRANSGPYEASPAWMPARTTTAGTQASANSMATVPAPGRRRET